MTMTGSGSKDEAIIGHFIYCSCLKPTGHGSKLSSNGWKKLGIINEVDNAAATAEKQLLSQNSRREPTYLDIVRDTTCKAKSRVKGK